MRVRKRETRRKHPGPRQKLLLCLQKKVSAGSKGVLYATARSAAPVGSVRLPGGARVEFGEERGVVGVGQRARRGARWHELDCAGAVPARLASRLPPRSHPLAVLGDP